MIKKIKDYVDELFEEAPKTKKVKELKDELIANLIEKYNDLLTKDNTEEEAYNIVIAGIGDISELIDNIDETKILSASYNLKERKRSAKNIAIAVMLYILSVVPVILFSLIDEYATNFGVVIMFIMIAIATGMLVYTGASKPKYLKENETMVEEFKEWKSKKSYKNAAYHTISSAFWMLIVAIYLVISFMFDIWTYSWIIFIVGAAISQIIKAIFELGEK